MASGTITGYTNSDYVEVKIEWESFTDEAENKSTVYANLYYKVKKEASFNVYGAPNFTLSIGSVSVSSNLSGRTEIGISWTKVLSAGATTTHNDDGTKSITIRATGGVLNTQLTSTTCEATVPLDHIDRVSTIDTLSFSTEYFTGVCKAQWTPKSSALYTKSHISLNLDGTHETVSVVNLGNGFTHQMTLPTSKLTALELSKIYGHLPNTTKGTLRFTMKTYTDSAYSNLIGEDYKEITLSIPDTEDTKPTALIDLAPITSLSAPFDALYIKGRTKVQATFTDAVGKYGATITSKTMSVLGKTYDSPFVSEYVTTDGTVAVKCTLTDSRGFERTYTENITVLPYVSPKIVSVSGESEVVCARCDKNGSLSEAGTYLKIKAKRSYSKVISDGTQYNFCFLQYRYRAEGGAYTPWNTILTGTDSSDEVITGALLGGGLLATNSYVVQILAEDTLGDSCTVTINVPTERVYLHRAGSIRSLGIGKYAEDENTVDIADDITTKFRGPVQFTTEKWQSLGLSGSVTEPSLICGRGTGTGCHYQVCAGDRHVYVAFNCAFAYENKAVQINAEPIPKKYRPVNPVYAICPADGFVAQVTVDQSGYILLSLIQATSISAKWVDGYIDYWV